MKKNNKESKLQLSKVTVENLNAVLDRKELGNLYGGTNVVPMGTTQVPYYCKP